MARPIKDYIVMERLRETKFDNDYIQKLEKYNGLVKSTIDRVKLDQSALGLANGVSPLTEFEDLYRSLDIKEDFGVITVSGRDFKCTVEELKVLKTLLMKHANRNEEYVNVVGTVWAHAVRQIASGVKELEFSRDVNWNKFQNVIFDYCIEFIRKHVNKEIKVQEVIEI